MLPEPPADVSALYEVYVVLIVTAWSHQHTQEVEIVTQVLDEWGPHTAERTNRDTLFISSEVIVITSGEMTPYDKINRQYKYIHKLALT